MHGSLTLSGAPNFRDLGGATAADGRVRPRRLLRSQGLHELSEHDLGVLRALDVRLVCDLRNERERALHVSRWPEGMPTHHMVVSADSGAASRELLELLRADPGAGGARAMMIANYRLFPTRFAAALRELFARLLASDASRGLPLLVHCSVGKDRTGFIVALLLAALRVPRACIYDDYELTARALTQSERVDMTRKAMHAMHGFLPGQAALEVIASVDASFLDAAFLSIDAQFGTVDDYLTSACGLPSALRKELVRLLVAP